MSGFRSAYLLNGVCGGRVRMGEYLSKDAASDWGAMSRFCVSEVEVFVLCRSLCVRTGPWGVSVCWNRSEYHKSGRADIEPGVRETDICRGVLGEWLQP